jgi:hypothetical protein
MGFKFSDSANRQPTLEFVGFARPGVSTDVTLTREFPFEVGSVERVEYLIKKK